MRFCLQLLQLYVASAVTGGISQSLFDKRAAGLGASAAVNAIVIMSVLLNPTATYLVYGIVPLPAWALGIGWLAYDSMGAYKVRLAALMEKCASATRCC